MHFLRRRLSADLGRRHHRIRTLYDAVASINCPRDRGLDHAVMRERHLKPVISLKNLILSEPSKSIPLSLISQSKENLEIPFRPIDFIRKYPSIFQEFHPGSLNIQPHIKLTPEVVSLSDEESLLYQSVNYKQEIADRLLKLLMISRVNKIPIFLLEQLKWELGLPHDYEKVVIPEFPDYFRVVDGKNVGGNRKELELVCWNDELAVSAMERMGGKDGNTQFVLQYSKEFEMDKKYKKWVDEWQKLPYVSPYENAMHLPTKTDESDKWAVAVLHELLSLFVGKKAEKESLLRLGEYFGLRSRFKPAFLQHPGIFYVSGKIGTYTVVLKEAYKRGILIERHALNDMRFKYAQLMNAEKKNEEKSKSKQQKSSVVVKKDGGEESKDDVSEDKVDSETYDLSDDDESEDYTEEDESEDEIQRGKFKRNVVNFEQKNSKRGVDRRLNGRNTQENEYESSKRFSRGRNTRDHTNPRRAPQKLDASKTDYQNSNRYSRRRNIRDYTNPRRAPQTLDASGNTEWSRTKKTPT